MGRARRMGQARIAPAWAALILSWSAAAQTADMPLPPERRAAFERFIRGEGYLCPSLNNFREMGLGPRGTIFRAWCGPKDSTDVISALVYRLDQMPDGLTRIRPWPGDPHRRPER